MGKRYYWLKLKDDFFTSKRIKKLRAVAGGDTYLIIYLKMQLLTLKTDGIITYTGLEDNIAAELALDLDEKEEDVRFTLNYLSHVGLLETSDEVNFFLPYVLENTGSEDAATQRKRDQRKREKIAKLCEDIQKCDNVTKMSQICHGEKEIEKEIEKDIEIEIEDDINTNNKRIEPIDLLLDLMSDEEYEDLSQVEDFERFKKVVNRRILLREEQTEIKDPYHYLKEVAKEEGLLKG